MHTHAQNVDGLLFTINADFCLVGRCPIRVSPLCYVAECDASMACDALKEIRPIANPAPLDSLSVLFACHVLVDNVIDVFFALRTLAGTLRCPPLDAVSAVDVRAAVNSD